MDQEKIGSFIVQCRKEKNMTQEQLAVKLNTTCKSISRWENGKTMPDYSIIKLLCNELDISINELLSGEKVKDNNYNTKADENLDIILKEYYKMKKQKNIIKTILLIISFAFISYIIRAIFLFGFIAITELTPSTNISGIDNYDKNYFLKEYSYDLDSNLSIFPSNKDILKDAEFNSLFRSDLFDSDGYILLIAKYNKEDFENEIARLNKISMKVYKNCKKNSKAYTNYIRYDTESYSLPAYVTIDGFGKNYEYALIDTTNFEITYVYLAYPNIDNPTYNKYLKIDKESYSIIDTTNMYSMYSHSFDNNKSFAEFDDCKK